MVALLPMAWEDASTPHYKNGIQRILLDSRILIGI